ncbi:uncharacterized protein [Periplaneta americana]|uniref:uncharacterized protein n=1 Tax=Periplaneta americana TaxID=6978 RepID=UPI0037E8BBC8
MAGQALTLSDIVREDNEIITSCGEIKVARRTLTFSEKLRIVAEADKIGNRAAASKCGVSESCVRSWRRMKDSLKSGRSNQCTFRGQKEKYPELEKALVQYIHATTARGNAVSTAMCQMKAKQLASDLETDGGCKFSRGWLERFMRRNGLFVQKRKIYLPGDGLVRHSERKRKLKLSDGTSTQAARKEDEDENPVVTVAHASDSSPTMSPDAVEDPLAVTGMQLQTEVSAVDSATVAGDLHPSVMDDSDVLIEYFGDPTHDHHLDEPAAQVFMDPDTKSIAETLLHLQAEKLLHEMDRLKLHREKMEAEKRNIKLRTEILALRKQLSVKDQICQLSSQPSRSSESDSVAASGEDPVSGVSVYDEQVIILQKPLDSVQLTPDIKGSAGMSSVTLNLHKDKPLKGGKRVTVKLLQPSGIIQQGQRVELSETSNKSVGHIIAQNCGVSLQGGDIEGLDRHIVPVKRKVTLLQGRTSVGQCNTLSSETRNVQENTGTCKNLSWYENSSQILNSHCDSENRNVRRSVGDDISESANENSLNAQFNPNECDTSPRSVLDTGQDICLSKRMKTEYYRYSESEPS